MWYGGDAMQAEHDAIILIFSFKYFKMFEVQSCELDARFNSGLELFSTVGFPLLHHMPYLADVKFGTKACRLTNAVTLY
jgi:hypothetical protein